MMLFRLLAVALVGGVVFVFWILMANLIKNKLKLRRQSRCIQAKDWQLHLKNPWLQSPWEKLCALVKRSNLGWSMKKTVLILAGALASAWAICLLWLKNPAAMLPGAGLAITIPIILILNNIHVQRNQLEKQLQTAIQLFVAEYQSSRSVEATINKVATSCQGALLIAMENLSRDLNSGNPEAYWIFAKELQSPWAWKLAHILNARYNKGIEIGQLLLSLYMELKSVEIQKRQRKSEMAAIKAENLLIYASLPFLYLFICQINPAAHQLLTQTSQGRTMISLLLWLLWGGIALTSWFTLIQNRY